MEGWFAEVMLCTFDQALIFLQMKNNNIIAGILFCCVLGFFFFFHFTVAAVGWSRINTVKCNTNVAEYWFNS